MPSVVDLCNSALRRLGQPKILTLDGNSPWQDRCNDAWPLVRDEMLRRETWRFSIKRVQLAPLAEAPIGDFSTKYRLPSDFLRLAALKLPRYEQWSLEGRDILCNKTDFLEILYGSRITDPNEYSTDFFNLAAWRLAVELSGYATTSTVRKDETYAMYQEALGTAIDINSKENPVDALDNTTWIDARYSNIDRGLYGGYFNDDSYGW